MKKLSFVFTVILSLVALPPLAVAKDKDKDKDKDKKKHHDDWKDTRNAVRELQEQSDRLQSSIRMMGASRYVRQDADRISGEVNRVSRIYDSGNYDRRDLEGRVSQLMSDIDRARKQMDYDRQRQGTYDYQRRGGYDPRYRDYNR